MDLDPNPATLSADPARFEVLVQLLIGHADGPGEESVQVREYLREHAARYEMGSRREEHQPV
jgi:hypothetical protein